MASLLQPENRYPTLEASLLIAGAATLLSLAAAQFGLGLCDSGLGSTGQGTRAFARSLLDSNLFVPIILSIYLGSTAIRAKHWIVSVIVWGAVVAMYLPFTYSGSWSGAEEKRAFAYALGDLRHAMINCCFVLNAGLIVLYCEHQRSKRSRRAAEAQSKYLNPKLGRRQAQ